MLIEGETIVAIGRNLPVAADQVIDCSGQIGVARRHRSARAPRHAFHGHLQQRHPRNRHPRRPARRHHHRHRLCAAEAGPLPARGPRRSGRAGPPATPSATTASTWPSRISTPSTKEEITDMVAEGITSFKTFMAYKGALMIDDAPDGGPDAGSEKARRPW